MLKLKLGHIVQNISLVFFSVRGTYKQGTPRAFIVFRFCVVSRGNAVKAEDESALQHFVKFNIAVAENAGIGSFAVYIALGEPVHDLGAEQVLEIENMVVYTKLVTDAACVLNVGERAAGTG